MFPLFFFGDEGDRRILETFRGAAQDRFGCAVLTQAETLWVPDAAFLLVEQTPPKTFRCGVGAVLLKDRFTRPPAILSCDAVCIVPSQNPQAVEWAAKSSHTTIACGTSPYDTLTFSSLTADRAVVSLQRQLVLPGSDVPIEPADFPISLKGAPDLYTILAISAVFLLSGRGEALTELEL